MVQSILIGNKNSTPMERSEAVVECMMTCSTDLSKR
jgi:hypothetical protein